MLQNYLIHCSTSDCSRQAAYKIASRCSDGLTSELKTYALCCEQCLPAHFAEARRKQAACRLAPGETLEPPAVYRLHRDRRDRDLERDIQLERRLHGC